MMENKPDRMIVLDFSGTLSLAAAQYGRAEFLLQRFKETGLWEIGVDSEWRYWTEIVNPTWEEGSTTAKGYQRLMCDRLLQLSMDRNDTLTEDLIKAYAAAFVADYFNHSILAPEWQPLLQWIVAQPEVSVVIATDHYAEATGHIMSQLQALGIEAIPAMQLRQPGQILIANSADLGYLKASQGFWEELKSVQKIERLSIIGIVDDFGFNEQAQDAYTFPEQITIRQEQTVSLLSGVFSVRVCVFPFFLGCSTAYRIEPGQGGGAGTYSELIDQATQFVQQVLKKSGKFFPCSERGTS